MWYAAEQIWACGTLPNKTIEYRFVRGGRHALPKAIENKIRACGGMVDTLVLGTSANAWEFESLHAHFIWIIIERC